MWLPPNATVVCLFDLVRQIFEQCIVHTVVPSHHVGHTAFFRVDFRPARSSSSTEIKNSILLENKTDDISLNGALDEICEIIIIVLDGSTI